MHNELNEHLPEVAATAEVQGWSESTLLTLAIRFIVERGQEGAFAGYAQAIADEENGEAADPSIEAQQASA